MRPLPRLALAALALLALAAPLAEAHLAFERPSIQRGEARRAVDAGVNGTAASVELLLAGDPLREAVLHGVLPAEGAFTVEHREHLSRGEDAARARFEIRRLVEFRDANADGRLTPDLDATLRAWHLPNLAWRAGPVQNGTVGGAPAKVVVWGAETASGPRFNLTLAAAGQEVVDEGARARPQDVLLYLDVNALPDRGVGNLHALEGQVVAPAGARLAEIPASGNLTAGLLLDVDGRRAFLLWGAQALVDGREQSLLTTVGPPVETEGNVTWELRLNFPTMDRSAHLVMVSGIEYPLADERETGGTSLGLSLAAALFALGVARLRPPPLRQAPAPSIRLCARPR